ncbi:MAG: hypothetical protein ABUK01_13605 [Leptospirales bacterium]
MNQFSFNLKKSLTYYIQPLEFYYDQKAEFISNYRLKNYLLYNNYTTRSRCFLCLEHYYLQVLKHRKSVFEQMRQQLSEGTALIAQFSDILYEKKFDSMRTLQYVRALQKFQYWLQFQSNKDFENISATHVHNYFRFLQTTKSNAKTESLVLGEAAELFFRFIFDKNRTFSVVNERNDLSKTARLISYQDLQSLFFHLPDQNSRLIFFIAYTCLLSPSKISALSRKSINMDHRTIYCSKETTGFQVMFPGLALPYLRNLNNSPKEIPTRQNVQNENPNKNFDFIWKNLRNRTVHTPEDFMYTAKIHMRQKHFLKEFFNSIINLF